MLTLTEDQCAHLHCLSNVNSLLNLTWNVALISMQYFFNSSLHFLKQPQSMQWQQCNCIQTSLSAATSPLPQPRLVCLLRPQQLYVAIRRSSVCRSCNSLWQISHSAPTRPATQHTLHVRSVATFQFAAHFWLVCCALPEMRSTTSTLVAPTQRQNVSGKCRLGQLWLLLLPKRIFSRFSFHLGVCLSNCLFYFLNNSTLSLVLRLLCILIAPRGDEQLIALYSP